MKAMKWLMMENASLCFLHLITGESWHFFIKIITILWSVLNSGIVGIWMGPIDMEALQFIDQLWWEVGWIQCLSLALELSGHLSEQCINRNSISGWGWCILSILVPVSMLVMWLILLQWYNGKQGCIHCVERQGYGAPVYNIWSSGKFIWNFRRMCCIVTNYLCNENIVCYVRVLVYWGFLALHFKKRIYCYTARWEMVAVFHLYPEPPTSCKILNLLPALRQRIVCDGISALWPTILEPWWKDRKGLSFTVNIGSVAIAGTQHIIEC